MQQNSNFSNPEGFSMPAQGSTFRFRKNPGSRRSSHLKRKTFIDPKLLENATEAVLKIVHRGNSQRAQEARDRERERIKKHVLLTMRADVPSKNNGESSRTRCLPETWNDMAKRTKVREEWKMSVEPKPRKESVIGAMVRQKPIDTTIDHFSFADPKDISGLAELPRVSKPKQSSVKKQVSFLSPEKPQDLFKTPSRPSQNAALSNPPPLLKHKRREHPDISEFPRNSEVMTPRRVPYDLLGLGLTESIFD